MARFMELFVRRPVLAMVVSLVILLLGLRSVQTLNVRQYPESNAAVVTITTPYAGANAELVRGFVTAPLEQVIASANGIDCLDSSSTQSASTIRAHLELNDGPNAAVAQILTKINQVRNQLPPDSENPIVTVSVGEFTASMYLAFASQVLAPHQVTDYLVRAVRPQLESIDGVQQAQIIAVLPDIQRQLPQGIEGQAVYDATVFIEQSIDEVITNLVQALVIVTVVIFLFLGSLRAVLVPAVAMPLSLVGAAFIMLVLGYLAQRLDRCATGGLRRGPDTARGGAPERRTLALTWRRSDAIFRPCSQPVM